MEEARWHALIGRLELLIEDYSLNAVKAALRTIETMAGGPPSVTEYGDIPHD